MTELEQAIKTAAKRERELDEAGREWDEAYRKWDEAERRVKDLEAAQAGKVKK